MNNFHSQVHKVGAREAVNCIATFLVIMYQHCRMPLPPVCRLLPVTDSTSPGVW